MRKAGCMDRRSKMIIPILSVLLIITLSLLYIVKAERDVLQKSMDRNFTNSIMDSMDGLSVDSSKIDTNNKIRYYYQVITKLSDALNLFHSTSYKEYDAMFQTLNRLYIYLLEQENDTYVIDNKLYIHEFLGKVMVFPDDKELISDFNILLDNLTSN